MVEESSPLSPPAEESIEAETDTVLKPGPESREPTPAPASEPGFVCDCEEWMRSACKSEGFYKEHKGNRYCVLHYPGKEKSAAFSETFRRKLAATDFDFSGVWFPDPVDFSGFVFRAGAGFHSATFSADADFSDATFCLNADFGSARFSATSSFTSGTFASPASFVSARFQATASFISAKFRATASFSEATFSGDAGFASASFSADVYFSDVSFSADAYFMSARFGSKADFISATFCSAANFSNAAFNTNSDFSNATFTFRAIFVRTKFSGFARFVSTKFCAAAEFSSAIFMAEAEFTFAVFSNTADFSLAKFNKVGYFDSTVFNDSVRFFGDARERDSNNTVHIWETAAGKEPTLDFQHARIEKPNKVAFHTVALRPRWFVNVDSREFIFTDVSWEWNVIRIEAEIESLTNKNVSSPHRLLAIACRQLAENAETNNRYEEASRFRYWAMDLARHYKWAGARFWKTDWLHILYWSVSGYGERMLRALGWLLVVWVIFAAVYTRVGFTQQTPKLSIENSVSTIGEDRIGQPLEFSRALTYSLAVMSLQKPEPRPLTNWAHTLVTLETILGPVQAALLALAIRRKFMR